MQLGILKFKNGRVSRVKVPIGFDINEVNNYCKSLSTFGCRCKISLWQEFEMGDDLLLAEFVNGIVTYALVQDWGKFGKPQEA